MRPPGRAGRPPAGHGAGVRDPALVSTTARGSRLPSVRSGRVRYGQPRRCASTGRTARGHRPLASKHHRARMPLAVQRRTPTPSPSCRQRPLRGIPEWSYRGCVGCSTAVAVRAPGRSRPTPPGRLTALIAGHLLITLLPGRGGSDRCWSLRACVACSVHALESGVRARGHASPCPRGPSRAPPPGSHGVRHTQGTPLGRQLVRQFGLICLLS